MLQLYIAETDKGKKRFYAPNEAGAERRLAKAGCRLIALRLGNDSDYILNHEQEKEQWDDNRRSNVFAWKADKRAKDSGGPSECDLAAKRRQEAAWQAEKEIAFATPYATLLHINACWRAGLKPVAIYGLFLKDRCIYVGQSRRVTNRLQVHTRRFYREFRAIPTVRILGIVPAQLATKREREFICDFALQNQAEWNKNGRKPLLGSL